MKKSIDDLEGLRDPDSSSSLLLNIDSANSISKRGVCSDISSNVSLPITESCSITTQSAISVLSNKSSKKNDKNGSSLSICGEQSEQIESSLVKSSDSTSGTSTASSNKPNGSDQSKLAKIPARAKRTAWYNVFYPSYKSRTQEFKRLFKDVPGEERLVTDYSCALQRDILVHGRLYVSQRYMCFHANIFGWETHLSLKWKDVTAITKEKTALVIPNAILVSTESEKYFITSFASRDNAFLTVFRVWQNALLEKKMGPQEMWHWVHNAYGDELGLTSDDEDYIDPYDNIFDSDKLTKKSQKLIASGTILSSSFADHTNDKSKESSFSSSELEGGTNNLYQLANAGLDMDSQQALLAPVLTEIHSANSESSSSEHEKNVEPLNLVECNSMHEGRQLIHTILPISIGTLFTLLFSKSQFLIDFHTSRKTTDLVFGEWVTDENGVQTRTVTLTVALSQAVGPKSAHVTEYQTIRDCSEPGALYSIDMRSSNAGIPYADRFHVTSHYCLVRTVDDHTMFSVHAQINYSKNVWGFVKGFIEKNTWNGLQDFYTALVRALQTQFCFAAPKPKGRRPRRTTYAPKNSHCDVPRIKPKPITTASVATSPTEFDTKSNYFWISCIAIALLFVLLVLNSVLFIKLLKIENFMNEVERLSNLLRVRDFTKSNWLKVLKDEERLNEDTMRTWHKILQTALDLLQRAEETLTELETFIQLPRAKILPKTHEVAGTNMQFNHEL